MARPKGFIKAQPTYRLHKPSGLACVTIDGKTIYLGKHDGEESRQRYDRLIGEWLARGRQGPAAGDPDRVTVEQVIAGFVTYAFDYYQQQIPSDLVTAMRWLRKHYGETLAKDFQPLQLKALRDTMIASKCRNGRACKLSRRYVNELTKRVVSVFQWATTVQMVDGGQYHALKAVPLLQFGRTAARESAPVEPVDARHVEAVLAIATKPIAAMIRLQLLTGMRPGEVCRMRACEIDTSGRDADGRPLWKYTPAKHKTQRLGKKRTIFLGPQAVELIKPFLRRDMTAPLFSPRESLAEFAERAPNVGKLAFAKSAGEQYRVGSYSTAVRRLCDQANKLAHAQQVKDERLVERWHPHQLRHNAATFLRKEFGIEVARTVLGHSSAAITEIYAAVDLEKAATAMSSVG